MGLGSILDKALFYLSVPKCVGCRSRLTYGELAFCPECSAVFEDFKTRNCSVCSKSSPTVKKAYLLLLTAKLIELCQPEARKDFDGDTLGAILEYCQKNYRSNLRQKDVAAALHISESYISHVFSAKMEINFCRYLNILRSDEAARLLVESKKSITEIAFECGFGGLRSFNRAFLDTKGVTPREYRKSRSEI